MLLGLTALAFLTSGILAFIRRRGLNPAEVSQAQINRTLLRVFQRSLMIGALWPLVTIASFLLTAPLDTQIYVGPLIMTLFQGLQIAVAITLPWAGFAGLFALQQNPGALGGFRK